MSVISLDPSLPVCYGYGRHSTVKQGLTKEAQLRKVKRYYEQVLRPEGVQWGGFYYDSAVSGRTEMSEREKGRAVYAMARPGDHVVVSRLDRPFRSVLDGVRVIRALQGRGVTFHSLDLLVDSRTPMGKFFVTVLLAVAELEREFASERVKEVAAARIAMGLPASRGCAIGWKVVGTPARFSENKRSSRRYRADEEERALVEKMVELRAAGKSTYQIASWAWYQREFPCKRRLADQKQVAWALLAHKLGYPKGFDCPKTLRQHAREVGAL